MVEGKDHTEAVDLWSLGVLTCIFIFILDEFIVGTPPFEDSSKKATFKNISNVQMTFPEFISKEAKDLVGKLLQREPEQRLPLAHVLKHEWILMHNRIKD